ncbi:MAG: TonB-dependent receptor [Gammaproteobacteria bacterium]|nr:TonB-dependent receptor [Gammaproteobacteria bacterium]
MRVIRLLTLTLLLGATSWSFAEAQVPANNDVGVQAVDRAARSLGDALGIRVTDATPIVGSLTGLVTDAGSGRPLSAAQVFIEGTGLGGLTNASGRYLIINVPAGTHTLRVELIGYTAASQEVTVADDQATTADFGLNEEVIDFDEIVVTGTAGQARRREVGNAIEQINIAEVAEPVNDVGALLQARVPGARIQFGSGNSGSGVDIRLRGNVSTALSNQPIIYIDGMRAKSEPTSSENGAEDPYSPLADINPDDIDRIEVIKGPAATTLYGTEAAAGVIQIFTKQGGQGAPQWTAEVQQGFSYFRPFGTDEVPHMFLHPVFQNGHRQRYSMQVRGGTGDVGYFVSAAWNDNLGAVETDSETKLNLRANTTFRPHEDVLIQFNNTLARTDLTQAQMGNSVTSIMMTAIRGPRSYMPGFSNTGRDYETLSLLLSEDYRNQITRAVSGLTVNYTPGADFTHRLTLGYDYSQDDHFNDQQHCWLCPIGRYGDFSDYIQGGEQRRGMSQNTVVSFDYIGTWGFELASNIRSTLSFGAQGVENEIENSEYVVRHYPGPGEFTLQTGATRQDVDHNRLRVITGGFFMQDQIGISNKYFLTVGARVDGNSAFGEQVGFALLGDDFRFDVYPKISGSYVISDEEFWPETLGQVKLRGAYGLAGRAPGAFDKVRTWSPVGMGPGGQAYYPSNRGNDALGPERTIESEFGMDGAWLDGRFNAEVTYYHQTTTDALFRVASPASEGGWGSQLQNVGEFENKGIEIQTNTTLLDTRSLRWDLGLGLATNHSKVLDLGAASQFYVGEYGWVRMGCGPNEDEGCPVPIIYGQRVMNHNDLADPIYSDGRVNYGPANPPYMFTGSMSFDLPGGLNLSARGEYLRGGWISNYFETGATWRTISHPKCYDAYRKVDPNWTNGGEYGEAPPPQAPATRPADMYAWEVAQCFGLATNEHGVSESDFAELRDVTLSIPVSNLLPSLTTWASRADLVISGRNVAFWTHKNLVTGHPEQNENSIGTTESGEFRHDLVKGIDETLPPVSYFTVSLRAIF